MQTMLHCSISSSSKIVHPYISSPQTIILQWHNLISELSLIAVFRKHKLNRELGKWQMATIGAEWTSFRVGAWDYNYSSVLHGSVLGPLSFIINANYMDGDIVAT